MVTDLNELQPLRDERPDTRPNRALLLSSGKSFQILDTQGPAFQGDVEPEDFLDIPPLGLQVWEGDWKQTGVESWEMSWIKEYHLVGDFRPATEEEVERYISGEYLWELPLDDTEDAATPTG